MAENNSISLNEAAQQAQKLSNRIDKAYKEETEPTITNIDHIEAVEGLAMQIGEHLRKIEVEGHKEFAAKREALNYLIMYQGNQIIELRRQFEG